MRKLVVAVLIFMAGWSLGWYSYRHWGAEPLQFARPSVPAVPGPDRPEATVDIRPMAQVQGDSLALLLDGNDFDAALQRYDSLQRQADEASLAEARDQILSHARRLIAERRYSLAEQLMQQFLVAAYRDVEARLLLAEAYQGQDDLLAAIDQLYEARGYAFRPAMLQRISGRIRSMVTGLAQSLKRNDDQNALRALYQQLIQLEPDHAPWFMGLAATQLALDDREAARRSLLLVAQDPDVGAQARAMLSELSVALAGMQGAGARGVAPEVVGIPLHRDGNHFIVDASPANGRSLRLLIDTGASLTILTPAVFQQRGIRYQDTGRTILFNTANGPVEAAVYILDALTVGDWQVRQLEIGVLDLGVGTGVNGLLGMNFLNRFQFFIDQNKALLRLSAN
ncbi:MAG: TIGR02281 family clan AA aspartic protease [Gammaproteobacteria bacterium]|jgi:clan AA aspartic protease (TIGR02281 family)